MGITFVRAVSPTGCGQMECDSQKKILIHDIDGTFTGTPSYIIPESERHWTDRASDRGRGIGDDKIPTTMQTTVDGERIPIDVVRPLKGKYDSMLMHNEMYRRLLHLDGLETQLVEVHGRPQKFS